MKTVVVTTIATTAGTPTAAIVVGTELKHEVTRQAFRPERITTPFVGKSVPKNGKFIYDGGTMMERHMEAGTAVPLAEFKARGWYIDDLVLTAVDQMPYNSRQRRAACLAARESLAQRIAEYRPQAIVVLQRSISADVAAAVAIAGSDAKVYHVRFPGNGQQGNFKKDMEAILPLLP